MNNQKKIATELMNIVIEQKWEDYSALVYSNSESSSVYIDIISQIIGAELPDNLKRVIVKNTSKEQALKIMNEWYKNKLDIYLVENNILEADYDTYIQVISKILDYNITRSILEVEKSRLATERALRILAKANQLKDAKENETKKKMRKEK